MLADAGLMVTPHPLDPYVTIRIHRVFEPYLLAGYARPQFTSTARKWFLALRHNYNQLDEDTVLFIVRGVYQGPPNVHPSITITTSDPIWITGIPAAGTSTKSRILSAQPLLDEIMSAGPRFDIGAFVRRTEARTEVAVRRPMRVVRRVAGTVSRDEHRTEERTA